MYFLCFLYFRNLCHRKKMFCMLVCFNRILILVLEILFFVVTAKITIVFVVTAKITIDDIVAINWVYFFFFTYITINNTDEKLFGKGSLVHCVGKQRDGSRKIIMLYIKQVGVMAAGTAITTWEWLQVTSWYQHSPFILYMVVAS